MQLQIHNLKRTQQSLKEHLQSCQRIQKKIKDIDKKVSYQGIERLNKVAFRQVQIKHTSEYTIYLGCQFYAQVKTNEALLFLNRKKKKYQNDLQKIQNHLKVLQKQNQVKKKTKETIQEINQKFSSSMQVIGKNQMGEDIFNIVQMEGEQEDISKWQSTKSNKVQIKQKSVQKQISQNSVACQTFKGRAIKSQFIQQIKQDSDQNLQDEKISDGQQYQEDDEQQDDLLCLNNRLHNMGIQSQLIAELNSDPQMKQVSKKENQKSNQINQKVQQKKQISSNKKLQQKVTIEEPPKKISKFKMQRLKERS